MRSVSQSEPDYKKKVTGRGKEVRSPWPGKKRERVSCSGPRCPQSGPNFCVIVSNTFEVDISK